MIYLLTAIGLSPGGSSTVHIYTQTIHRTTQNKQYLEQQNNLGDCGSCPVLASYTLAFALQLRKHKAKCRNLKRSKAYALQLGRWNLYKYSFPLYKINIIIIKSSSSHRGLGLVTRSSPNNSLKSFMHCHCFVSHFVNLSQ